MPKRLDESDKISPDYFNQGRSTSAGTPPVQHYEIGETAYFLKPYGHTYREALENLITGSIQIIGLDEVKLQYAEQWGTILKNVDKIADAFLTRRLGKHDIFVPLDEGRFALLFAGLSREEAMQKSQEIAADLVNKLFGELPGGELISVEAAMLEIEDFDGLDKIKNHEDLVNCFRLAIEKTQDKETREFRKRRPRLSIRFRPLINRKKRFVGINETVAYNDLDGDLQPLTTSDPIFSGSPRLRSEMDFLVLRETGKTLSELGDVGNKPIIFLSVHFETLANAFCRGKYARILSALPEYTCRHLILNVQGTVTGTPNSRYRQIFTSLRTLVLGFSFEVNPEWSEFEAIRDLPVHAIVVSGHNVDELKEIGQLIEKTKEQGKKCIWRSIDNDVLARAAFEMGIDYVSGPTFGSVHSAPAKPFSLSR
jgi:hypothetical protein